MNNSQISRYQNQLQDMLGGAQSVGIIVGDDQSLDTMGAALGLYLVLTQNGKSAQVVSKKEPIVELSNLFGIDRVSKSFDGATKVLTISVPYREGEIEKVSYNIEQDRLNVNLFAEENGINFDENQVEYIRKGASPSVIVTLGVLDESEIANLVDLKNVKIIAIDRNPLSNLAGDITVIDPSFSSVSEIVTSMINALGMKGDADAFQNLMDGITYATKNFTNPTTSANAFEAAGFLLSNGAKRKDRVVSGSDRQGRGDNRFPSKDQFLNRKPRFHKSQNQNTNQNPRPQQMNQPRQNMQNQPAVQNYNQGGQNQVEEQNYYEETQSQPEPQNNQPSRQNTSPVENVQPQESMPEEIPDDWFLPKVFKGSKKGTQN